MKEDLIDLLKEAYENGIITSSVQSQIDAMKKNLKLSEAEYQQIDDGIRVDTYIRKVKEREKKGVTFMGDLRKQYRITEDDKPLIEEKWNLAAQKKPAAPVQAPAPVKKTVPAPTKASDALRKSEELAQRPMVKSEPESVAPAPAPAPAPKKAAAAPKPTPVPAPAQVSRPAAEPTGPLVLVADDNETQLFLTRKTLEEAGYQCVTADSPETAVRIIAEKQPALVLCDINFGIGKPTGLDVFTNTRTKKFMMPFILVSAFIQKEFKDHAKRIGVTEYITKPTEPEELIVVVKKYIG